MGRGGRETPETRIPLEEDEDLEMEDVAGGGFFACYLLCSLSPRFKGRTYIGFTTNPRRRIRQHNGELCSGARSTRGRRPWEMVVCIYGFPTQVSALQFEWAWQHPRKSLAVRQAVASFKTFSGVANKLKVAYTMLTLSSWENLYLTVNFFSTKYMKHAAGCPSLPKQMSVKVCVMDELPCNLKGQMVNDDDSIAVESEKDYVDCTYSGSFETSNFYSQEGGHLKERALSDDLDNLIGCSDMMRSVRSDYLRSNASLDKPQSPGRTSDEFLRRREPDGFVRHQESPEEYGSLSSNRTEPLEKDRHGSDPVSLMSWNDPFECFTLSSIYQLTDPSTPISDNKRTLPSQDDNVLVLSTPSSFELRPCNKRASLHPDIIDLTNSPLCIQL